MEKKFKKNKIAKLFIIVILVGILSQFIINKSENKEIEKKEEIDNIQVNFNKEEDSIQNAVDFIKEKTDIDISVEILNKETAKICKNIKIDSTCESYEEIKGAYEYEMKITQIDNEIITDTLIYKDGYNYGGEYTYPKILTNF